MLRFRLSNEGNLISAAVLISSGSTLLDRIALRTINRAAPFPRPPHGMSEAQRTFEIAVNFR